MKFRRAAAVLGVVVVLAGASAPAASAASAPAVRHSPTSIWNPTNPWESFLRGLGCIKQRAWWCNSTPPRTGQSGAW